MIQRLLPVLLFLQDLLWSRPASLLFLDLCNSFGDILCTSCLLLVLLLLLAWVFFTVLYFGRLVYMILE